MRIILFILFIGMFLISCGGTHTYSVGVYNNTSHTPIKLKIQYPSPAGMKRIRFSMINIGEFKSNYLDTKNNPVPKEVKITWENSRGEKRSAVVGLSQISAIEEESAIIFHVDEYDAKVEYFNKEQFAGEWEKRFERKGYE